MHSERCQRVRKIHLFDFELQYAWSALCCWRLWQRKHRWIGNFHSQFIDEWYVYFKQKSFVCVHLKDFNAVGHYLLCVFYGWMIYSYKHFMRKVQGNIWNQDQFQPSGRKTSAIISEQDHRMVGEYLFAVCANITCTVRYTFPVIPKRYFAWLSCAYTCISPNRFRLNCIICAPSHELTWWTIFCVAAKPAPRCAEFIFI